MSDQTQYEPTEGPATSSEPLTAPTTTESRLNALSQAPKPLAHEVDLERFNDLVQRCQAEREAKEAELEQIAGEARALQVRYDAAKAEAKALVMRERALRAGIRTMEDFGLQHHGV